MQQFIGTSLKTRLYLLVLVAFVPVAALIFYVAEEQKTLEIQAFLQKALVLARSAAYEESQQLESTRNLLAMIADAYLISESHGNEVTGPWSKMITHLKGYANAGILDPYGRLVAGTDSLQIGRDYSNTVWYQDSRKNKKWTIGPYYGARNSSQPVLYFARPVLNHRDQIVAVAFAALDLNWMNRTIVEHLTGLPEGSRLTLLDEDNGLIRYDSSSQQWSGPTEMNQTLRRQIVTKRSGTLRAMDENKLSRIYAFAPLSSTLGGRMVTMILEIPEATALAATKRIFQESLTNILRHARADNVEVRLEKDNGGVMLQVRDNGRGITEAEINDPTAYGLLGMRERLYPWNGHVSFEGRLGGGTCVTIRLPMAGKREGDRP